MLLLRADDLKRQGINFHEASQMVFHNLIFTKGLSFSSERREAAIAICQKYLKDDILCLVVESQGNYTLWHENKNVNLPVERAAIPALEGLSSDRNPFLSPPEELQASAFERKHFKNQSGAYQPGASPLPPKNRKTPAAL